MKRTFITTFPKYPKLILTLIYKRGKLSETKGFENIEEKQYAWVTRIAPLDIKLLDLECKGTLEKLKGKIEIKEVIKDKTLNTCVRESWFIFYFNKYQFEPNYRGIEGKAVKGIITYLRKLTNSDEDVLSIWQNLLSRWDELDAFTQSKCELTYINSKLSTILAQLKGATDDRSI